MKHTIHSIDAIRGMSAAEEGAFDCCVTSPPYWGLRDYGVAGQLGLEETPEQYVAGMVAVFREVRRVLADDGTLWLNVGDSYAANRSYQVHNTKGAGAHTYGKGAKVPDGLKPKDLVGIPWMLAFALRADGWYLRSDIIWSKPNGMPESTKDRPTRAHEYVFLLSKSERYYYDAAAIRTPLKQSSIARLRQDFDAQQGSDSANGGAKTNGPMKAVMSGRPPEGALTTHSGAKAIIADKQRGHGRRHAGFNARWGAMTREEQQASGANARDVWTIATARFRADICTACGTYYPKGKRRSQSVGIDGSPACASCGSLRWLSHFATMPEELARRCICAGSRIGGTVLDPFGGAGTTALAAEREGRNSHLLEINSAYAKLAEARLLHECGA